MMSLPIINESVPLHEITFTRDVSSIIEQLKLLHHTYLQNVYHIRTNFLSKRILRKFDIQQTFILVMNPIIFNISH